MSTTEKIAQLSENNEKAKKGGSLFPIGKTFGKIIPVELLEKAMAAKVAWTIQIADGRYETTLSGVHAGYNGKDLVFLKLDIEGTSVLDMSTRKKMDRLKSFGVIVGEKITDVKFVVDISTTGEKQVVSFHESGAANATTTEEPTTEEPTPY